MTRVLLLNSDFLLLLGSLKVLLAGIGFIVFAAYVSLSSRERLERHPRLRQLKDRHLAEFFAGGIMFTAFASALLTKLWFDSGAQASELETGLTVGLVIISVLAAIALGLFRFTSKLRD